ncbi:MAG: hypothetical protein K9G27_03425 [Sphingomonadaceae bacterium]|jgi:hypothetical protein|uniref:hypothetical protein n=1 Tax=Sphingorhabdus sp. TaxID=1902408 RepID=UPI002FD8F6B1|nr:hypothetical protein [Sphingomonadaceae bacterium]
MQDRLQLLAEHWVSYKFWLIETVGLTNDAMHVHGSLLILCVSALVLRRRPDSLWCWLIVFIAELFNEYADLRGAAPGEATMDAALHDIYNTMFWPTVILILGRFLFPRQKATLASPTAASSDLPQ